MSFAKDYSKKFSEKNFWRKIQQVGKVVGKTVVEPAMTLFYTLGEPNIPVWVKGVIIGALGYFISPVDAISDFIPLVGYSDDLGVLVAAVGMLATYITPNSKKKAKGMVNKIFGE